MQMDYYFDPVCTNPDSYCRESNSFGYKVKKHISQEGFPDWIESDIALIGVPEYRDAGLTPSDKPANQAREALYRLSPVNDRMNITDLGNLKPGKSAEDSFAAIRDIAAELIVNKVIPLFIGGYRYLTGALFRSYEINNQIINITEIDSRTGLRESGRHLSEQSYLEPIIKSRTLFNYTNIGYQSYFTQSADIILMEELGFDLYRVGLAKESIREMEPVLRDTDMLSLSLASIRQSDAPSAISPSPNGFFGEEVCQLAWYAGKSEKVSSFAITGWYSDKDKNNHTAHQAAQIAWYFAEGFYKREGEYPFTPSGDNTKFIVDISGNRDETSIVFYKSNKSGRWWMEIPSTRLPGKFFLACSYDDYKKACSMEIPDRWWQHYRKINN